MKLSKLYKKVKNKIEIGSIVHADGDGYTRVVKIENNRVYGWWVNNINVCRTGTELGYGVDIKRVSVIL